LACDYNCSIHLDFGCLIIPCSTHQVVIGVVFSLESATINIT
jgi:hypothetical protein